jgi:hypothetical protein
MTSNIQTRPILHAVQIEKQFECETTAVNDKTDV